MKFKAGDRVIVKWSKDSLMWNGPAVVTSRGAGSLIYVMMDKGGYLGAFEPKYLTLQTVVSFKVGDTVRAPGRGHFDTPSVVYKIDRQFVYIRPSAGDAGGFLPKNLVKVYETAPVKDGTVEPEKYPYTSNPPFKVLTVARNIAVKLAKTSVRNLVNADTVHEELLKQGYKSSDLGNAAGSIFKGKNWTRRHSTKSTRKGNRGRQISNWTYVGL